MKDYSYLYNIRNILKNQINKLHQSKVLTNVQVKNLLNKVERGHQTTLEPLLKTLFNVKGKTTLSNIYAGKSQEVKKQYNVSDKVFYRTNKKLFGKSKITEEGINGGYFLRDIKAKIEENTDISVSVAKKLSTYDKYIHEDINKSIRQLYKHKNISSAILQLKVVYCKLMSDNYDFTFDKQDMTVDYISNCRTLTIRYLTNMQYIQEDTQYNNEDMFKIKEETPTPMSNINMFFIGYKILFKYDEDITGEDKKEVLENLKAFHPSNDVDYHKLTVKSTHINTKLCIYETFEYIQNYDNQSNYFKNYTIEQRLKKEGEEIEQSILNGYLFRALPLLNIKYNVDNYVVFYKTNKIIYINKKGDIKQVDDIQDGEQLVFLYDKEKEHVAPSKFNKLNMVSINKPFVESKNYALHPAKPSKKIVDINNVINNTIAFDFETFIDNTKNAIPYCCCVYGKINSIQYEKTFYGLDCANKFIDWLLQFRQLLNHNKKENDRKINHINVYGFNNSNFDNKFIYTRLNQEDKNTQFIVNNNSIKKIQYNNITFYDLNILYSSGSLNDICINLGFGGKYDVDTKKITIDNFNDNMDMMTKYCMRDSELTYKLALDHINNSINSINGINYNTLDCITVGSVSKKIYNTVFQKDVLYGSPKDILVSEKKAHFGGRTSVFKKEFKSDEPLYYIDMNSAHPFAMTKMMPYKYKRTYNIKMTLNSKNYKCISDTSLYYISSYKYIGNDDNVINNILEHDDNGEIQTYKNYDKQTEHWGCEIKQACLNNFEFIVYKYIEYEEKPVFKSYIDYMYNERLKVKQTNKSKSTFYKNMMNNLYGKFSQKAYDKVKIVNDFQDIFQYIGDDMELLVDYIDLPDKMGILTYKDTKSNNYINPLTRFSSYIASLTRTNLHKCMVNVGFNSVFYCDTDSIFTTKLPDAEFLDDSKLGSWKLEATICEAVFIAPKLYYYRCVDNTLTKKSKGIKSNLLDVNDYDEMAQGKTVSKEHTVFIKQSVGVKILNQTFTMKSNHKTILN